VKGTPRVSRFWLGKGMGWFWSRYRILRLINVFQADIEIRAALSSTGLQPPQLVLPPRSRASQLPAALESPPVR
jgi:hypothetical protein